VCSAGSYRSSFSSFALFFLVTNVRADVRGNKGNTIPSAFLSVGYFSRVNPKAETNKNIVITMWHGQAVHKLGHNEFHTDEQFYAMSPRKQM